MNNRGDIVVGYDGSSSAKIAVEFAAMQAFVHQQAPLRIVAVWNHTPPPGTMGVVVADVEGAREQLAKERLHEAVGLARTIWSALEIEAVTVEGRAGIELVRASQNARLLVVGCRGLGGIRGLVIGSVSHHCTLHATCPVLVIPANIDGRPPPID